MSYGWVADPLDLAGVALFSFEIVVADVIMVSLIVAVGYLVMMRTFFRSSIAYGSYGRTTRM